MIREGIHAELLKRLKEKRRFVQVFAGPRQVGKTTVVRQVMEAAKIPGPLRLRRRTDFARPHLA